MIDLIPEFTACGKFWNCKQAYIVGDINVETRDFYQFTNLPIFLKSVVPLLPG